MTEEVIQADREAAADLWSAVFPNRQGEADCMRRGIGDDGPVVAALAKHRLAHLPTDLSEENAKLREALEPLARMRLSTEGEVSDCVLRSPAQEARNRAVAIEKRDAEILAARTALGDTQ